MGKKPSKKPVKQGSGLGRNGLPPPEKGKWKPGQSGNPKGRPPAGLTILEHINGLVHAGAEEKTLRRIAKDKSEQVAKRIAARRLLSAMDVNDLADFADVVEGVKTLADLRSSGVDTTVLKKAKTRFLKDGGIEREIEIRDSAGEDFDRIMDRTIGKSRQTVELEGSTIPTAVFFTPLSKSE